jgi:hypothetical protein
MVLIVILIAAALYLFLLTLLWAMCITAHDADHDEQAIRERRIRTRYRELEGFGHEED